MPEYLGDGVYASFDGFQIWVHTDVEGRRHAIAFDDTTVGAFEDYLIKVRAGEVESSPPPR